jgi:hypothetical protein
MVTRKRDSHGQISYENDAGLRWRDKTAEGLSLLERVLTCRALLVLIYSREHYRLRGRLVRRKLFDNSALP